MDQGIDTASTLAVLLLLTRCTDTDCCMVQGCQCFKGSSYICNHLKGCCCACRGISAGADCHHGSCNELAASKKVLLCCAEVILAGMDGYNGEAVDIWSCGLILFIMLTGRYPFLVGA